MIKYKLGFTAGVFDMFHIGHLNLIKEAKRHCDKLIVGVNSDELVECYKHKKPIIPVNERMEIVEAISFVDGVVKTETLDKLKMHETVGFDAVFIGDDWKGSQRWIETEKALNSIGVDVVYIPYTKGVSSSMIREKIGENNG